ncbi:MAG: radical SAM family heme chaperone HemW [Oscillospiraceae bacterium]|nr:radical SAM family heme chaperone HemW [Oscillospiraceae bacterium]
MLGIYIHVPFCSRKCPYCAFYSVTYSESLKDDYVNAIARNIRRYSDMRLPCDTVYFGGGTPSLLTPGDVNTVMEAIRSSFNLSPSSEITMEANPCSVTADSLSGYYRAGVNRLSFGVQSLNDNELRALGRIHDAKTALNAIDMARTAGFENISCDLMIGTPYQTMDSLLGSCRQLTSLGIPHISSYMLKIEDGTPYDCNEIRNSVADEDTVCDMYLALCDELRTMGYERYEISNFAKNGLRSRHNMKYWTGEDYLGFGPSAHSLFNGKRFYVPNDLHAYISSAAQPELIEDASPDRLEEYIMLSLRLSDGVSLERVNDLGGNAYAVTEKAKPYADAGFLSLTDNRITLIDKGALVSNSIIFELYSAATGE